MSMDEIPQLPEQSKKKERAACITRWVVLIAFCLLQAFNIVRLQTEITQKKLVDACAAWCVYVKWVLIFSIKPVIFRSFGLHLVLPGMPQSGFVVFHTHCCFSSHISVTYFQHLWHCLHLNSITTGLSHLAEMELMASTICLGMA